MKKILFVFTLSLILAATGYVFSAGYYGTTNSGATGTYDGTGADNITTTNLTATSANITTLTAATANITSGTVNATLTGDGSGITGLSAIAYDGTGADNITTTNLTATSANVTTLNAGTANITDTGTANVLSVTDLTVSSVANVTGVTWTGFAGDTTGNAATATTATTANALAVNAAIVTDNVNISGGNVTGITNFSAVTANVTTLTTTGVTAANVINASGTLTAVPSSTSPIMFGNTTPVNTSTGATFPTATKTQISKASAFTNAAVGDLIIVTGGTGATTGQYRLTTKTSNDLVVVDRNIHASGTDITDGAFTVYKDIISVSPTDATNGQLMTAYSHTNKPLQLGGTTLAATGHTLTNTDVLFGGGTEFNGIAYFDNIIAFYSDIYFQFGAQATTFNMISDDGLHISLNQNDGYTNNNLIITSYANRSKDHDHDTPSTNPTLFIHSGTDPDSANTQWMSFAHDTVDGVIDTGLGLVKIKEDSANSSETASSGGGFARRIAEATSGTLSGATGTIAVNVPTGARILGVQLRVDTAVTFSGTDTTWKAVYVNTPTTAICATQAQAKSTKFSAVHPAYEITTGTVTITVSSDGSDTFTAGVIRAIVYYEDTIAMSNAP